MDVYTATLKQEWVEFEKGKSSPQHDKNQGYTGISHDLYSVLPAGVSTQEICLHDPPDQKSISESRNDGEDDQHEGVAPGRRPSLELKYG